MHIGNEYCQVNVEEAYISLVIITWLAYSCRNRMLRHCPTDDRIIGGKKKGE